MNRQIKVDLSTPVKSLVAEETPTVDDTKESGDKVAPPVETKADAKPSTKPSGQSIAQVADVGNDDDTEDGKDNAKKPDGSQDKSAKKGPSVFEVMLENKKENRELKRMMRDEIIPTMKEMQAQIKNGSLSKADAKDELDELAEKYELEPSFVKDLARAIQPKTAPKADEDGDKYLSNIKDIADDEKAKASTKAARISVAVASEFDRVVADIPEYAKVAKKDVIQKLILSNEEYQDMAMEDVLAEVYGVVASPGMDGYSGQGANHTKQIETKNPSDEDHVALAQSRERGGEDFDSYADNLIERMQGKSKHAK